MIISRGVLVVFFVVAFGACGQESKGAATETKTTAAFGPECQKVEQELTTVCGGSATLTDGEKGICDMEQKILKATSTLVKVNAAKGEEACTKQLTGWTEKGGLSTKVKTSGALMDKVNKK